MNRAGASGAEGDAKTYESGETRTLRPRKRLIFGKGEGARLPRVGIGCCQRNGQEDELCRPDQEESKEEATVRQSEGLLVIKNVMISLRERLFVVVVVHLPSRLVESRLRGFDV